MCKTTYFWQLAIIASLYIAIKANIPLKLRIFSFTYNLNSFKLILLYYVEKTIILAFRIKLVFSEMHRGHICLI